MNRLDEFRGFTASIRSQKHGTSSSHDLSNKYKSNVLDEAPVQMTRSEFQAAGAQIGRDIFVCAENLQRLAKLAKSSKAYNDPAQQFQDLTNTINDQIKQLNEDISVLQSAKTNRNKQTETHSSTVINTLKSKLRKTAKEFNDVLETRTRNMKKLQETREKYTGPSTDLISFGSDFSDTQGETILSMPETMVTTQQQYSAGRLEAIRKIEQTMTELQGIFQQLAVLVAEQGEMITRIDENVNETESNVNAATNQLLTYLGKVNDNRSLTLKVFGILLVFVILFIVFFA